MDILYTKKDFLDIFSTMGIDEGMVVLVQADLTGFNADCTYYVEYDSSGNEKVGGRI